MDNQISPSSLSDFEHCSSTLEPYNPQDYTFFFTLHSPYSNFHPSRFIYKDLNFISSEQFMMYAKAKTFNDEETASRILNIYNEFQLKPGMFRDESEKLCFQLAAGFQRGEISAPQILQERSNCEAWNTIHKKIKKLGREVKNFDEKIWNAKREKVVLFGAREKFSQNPHLKSIFLATGHTKFVEASRFDNIWGIGLSEAEARNTHPSKWPGLNLLGKVLTQLKHEFQSKLSEVVKSKGVALCSTNSTGERIKEIEVKNFYTLNKTIPEDGVYIGRYNHNYNLPASIFANPYPVRTPAERGTTIGRYRLWFLGQVAQGSITKDDIKKLWGKTLVCYCKPLACHGDVVKEFASLLFNNEVEFDRQIRQILEHRCGVSVKPNI